MSEKIYKKTVFIPHRQISYLNLIYLMFYYVVNLMDILAVLNIKCQFDKAVPNCGSKHKKKSYFCFNIGWIWWSNDQQYRNQIRWLWGLKLYISFYQGQKITQNWHKSTCQLRFCQSSHRIISRLKAFTVETL